MSDQDQSQLDEYAKADQEMESMQADFLALQEELEKLDIDLERLDTKKS